MRDHLGPALLHTYAEVNVVEGLDVDKEDFDKYATRWERGREEGEGEGGRKRGKRREGRGVRGGKMCKDRWTDRQTVWRDRPTYFLSL